MEFFMLLIGIIILIVAFSFFLKLKKSYSEVDSSFKTQKSESGKIEFVRCPICNTPFKKNENLHSRIFRPMNTPDQRMMIQGCPHCYPSLKDGVSRTCPVCHKNISLNDELVARLFNRSDTKKHVMIMGCTICMKISKK